MLMTRSVSSVSCLCVQRKSLISARPEGPLHVTMQSRLYHHAVACSALRAAWPYGFRLVVEPSPEGAWLLIARRSHG